MKISVLHILKLSLFSLSVCIFLACGSQKDTASSRGMQNLTARYNYIYNANLALSNHQTELSENSGDNYDQVLPVYLGPETDNNRLIASLNIKEMDEIIKKAQVVILEKSFSNYLDEAYILLGKANFYNGSYFTASEYLAYATKAYRTNSRSYIEALNWQARSLMQINRITVANQVLDSLKAALPSTKKDPDLAGPFATMAQMSIYQNNITGAISYLKDAIRASNVRLDKIRWTYILGQLYEKQKHFSDAIIQYRKVQKSNAPFEMYFNAKLSQIRINYAEGKVQDKQAKLLALIKDDKNAEYIDQVYFQIAEELSSAGAYREAQTNYQKAIRASTSNQYQKGLSYLRMADLNFRYLKNYLKAKTYYDSTVAVLPKNYPDYQLILKKSLNLEYLTQRYQAIALEDTLQAIANLPIQDRMPRIENFVIPAPEKSVSVSGQNIDYNYQPGSRKPATSQNSFYFSNPTAISMGYSDFKKKWGNRKLENNWRQSNRSSAQAAMQDVASSINTVNVPGDSIISNTADSKALIALYSSSLPLTPNLLKASNQKIIDAYYEIASFYLQELNDPKEAEEVYLTLLKHFPENNHRDATFYSLYLINLNSNPQVAEGYKNQILRQFPNSVYAKTILDPSFSSRQSEAEIALNKQYNNVFDQYQRKDFNGVMASVAMAEKTPYTFLAAQFDYLNAIAIGRTYPVDTLISAFNHILNAYPNDLLITPLVKDHLSYINLHLDDFRKRKVALIDFDPNEPPFNKTDFPGQTNAIASNPKQPIKPAVPQTEIVPMPAPPISPAEKPASTNADTIKSDGTFSTAISATYYFVVDVSDASLTLSSSRFGVGQFNRGTYAGSNLRHQLKEFDNEQLIYVGNFSSFEDAKAYAGGISPQLKQIMKVPVSIYTSFIISKENFDKLSSSILLKKYIEFYKNNY